MPTIFYSIELERYLDTVEVRSSSLLVPTIFSIMPTTYILKSESTGGFYIGSALHLDQRLAEHARGHSPYTRGRGPWVLTYSENYATLSEARRRERQIKSWKSSRSVQDLIDAASWLEPTRHFSQTLIYLYWQIFSPCPWLLRFVHAKAAWHFREPSAASAAGSYRRD